MSKLEDIILAAQSEERLAIAKARGECVKKIAQAVRDECGPPDPMDPIVMEMVRLAAEDPAAFKEKGQEVFEQMRKIVERAEAAKKDE